MELVRWPLKGVGHRAFRAYNTAHYHQPSDEYRESWDLRGYFRKTEISIAIGRRISDMDQMPRFNPDDEFARVQQR